MSKLMYYLGGVVTGVVALGACAYYFSDDSSSHSASDTIAEDEDLLSCDQADASDAASNDSNVSNARVADVANHEHDSIPADDIQAEAQAST